MNLSNFNKILIISLLALSTCKRPDDRSYVSPIIDNFINEVKQQFKDPKLANIYESCFPNTLDTTVEYNKGFFFKEEAFIITGDIKAMWQRDSTFQLLPYMKFLNKDKDLKQMVQSLMRRQITNMNLDAYANAFNKNSDRSPWMSDNTTKLDKNGNRIQAMTDKLWERKYELDSVISPFLLACEFFDNTGDSSFIDDNFIKAIKTALILIKEQMQSSDQEDAKRGPAYTFQRTTSEAYDTLHQGRGAPAGSCGLVKTMFRNSDDAVTFAYNIPENAMMVATFMRLSKIINKVLLDGGSKNNNLKNEIKRSELTSLSEEIQQIAQLVNKEIYAHGVFTDSYTGEKYLAYEVDCYGNHYFIDDPGYPSLISLPYFKFMKNDDALYVSTRKRALSIKNPFFFKGALGSAIGSAHTTRRYVWPLGLIMQAMTSNDQKEIAEIIELLKKSALETEFMHESFNIDNAKHYSRYWFAWANSFFGLMINDVNERFPDLLLKGKAQLKK